MDSTPLRSLIFRRAHSYREGPNGLVRRHMPATGISDEHLVAWTVAWTAPVLTRQGCRVRDGSHEYS